MCLQVLSHLCPIVTQVIIDVGMKFMMSLSILIKEDILWEFMIHVGYQIKRAFEKKKHSSKLVGKERSGDQIYHKEIIKREVGSGVE